MKVVPVIDIRHGLVVRAVAGNRASYQPIQTRLFEGCDPRAAVAGLMALHPFAVIYIADLDGIEGRGANLELAGELAAAHPGVGLWVDCGARKPEDVRALLVFEGVSAVVGSETGIGADEIGDLRDAFGDRVILSLDFRAEGFVGKPALLDDPSCWPARVIAMTLGRVGRAQGPDLETIAAIAKRARAGTRLYAAGGVRNRDDLRALAAMGVAGALVSSALHAETITADDLQGRSPTD